jgi:hypothetical protein
MQDCDTVLPNNAAKRPRCPPKHIERIFGVEHREFNMSHAILCKLADEGATGRGHIGLNMLRTEVSATEQGIPRQLQAGASIATRAKNHDRPPERISLTLPPPTPRARRRRVTMPGGPAERRALHPLVQLHPLSALTSIILVERV